MNFDYWWLCDDQDWLKEAAVICQASKLVVQLKIMSLDTKMSKLLMSIRDAESRKQDVTPIAEEYALVMKRHSRLRTQEGANEFLDEMLEKAYNTRRIEKEEVLPL